MIYLYYTSWLTNAPFVTPVYMFSTALCDVPIKISVQNYT